MEAVLEMETVILTLMKL